MSCTNLASSPFPLLSRKLSNSGEESKWSSIAFFPRPVTIIMFSIPEATHSSTTYWINGLSTTGSISLGCALVAGRNRVPSPAAGRTALRTRIGVWAICFYLQFTLRGVSGRCQSIDYPTGGENLIFFWSHLDPGEEVQCGLWFVKPATIG